MRLALCGASGFIGRHLVGTLAREGVSHIRLLAHHRDPTPSFAAPNLQIVPGDLKNPLSLAALVSGVSTVVNLAYLADESRDTNRIATANLVQACKAAQVRRLVHLSTAAVVGTARANLITESTLPESNSEYERTKLEIERTLLDESATAFELIILRPTAVFGPWGRNLVKLATSLSHGSAVENYLRACIHGRRKMNLVCVDNVTAAILFATRVAMVSGSETFIVSDDDEGANNYRDVESTLRRALGRGQYAIAPPAVPSAVLRALLRWSGRSNSNPNRVYSGAKIAAAGFRKAVSLEVGLAQFCDWFRQADPKAEDSLR